MTRAGTSVLFVCLGNICRSPLAEGVMRHLVRARGIEARYRIDSAGTGAWHVGEPPDGRSVDVASRNGIQLEGHSRQVESSDLHDFDWVVAMDRSNLERLEEMKDWGGGDARLTLLREFDPDPGDREVPDPYYGGPGGFDHVYRLVHRSLEAFLDHLEDGR
ncbi:MAG: low molecular weight protein-tyrosine-phosphatase [Gemmatimonadota bacterium]|jgi:protein-tyrosine phosphatase